ncbi:Histone H3 (Lys9) methyltransferase SUV39H1/Clr4 [Klebsormidium nitens]|uniref:Histone H3 (Lys9) methyltransferase SUV39H1/Clr4 n=1 Tax=Klebsormidium nitens TaxID=105231 RepID=A0A1Y1IHU7_KLENI|nr:Histone H3 (Lys9) methyltransferase SUV39H1/Clr4 [Klebsormidium nitens]|eukprot:GAQ88286.1 Histone H3 (Lys9) methyltransferase SUV39H1/Clr4 [Klebsormidium nitens]
MAAEADNGSTLAEVAPNDTSLIGSYTKGGRERVQRRAAISAGHNWKQQEQLLKDTKLAGKRRAPSNAASKPSKSQKAAATESPCGSGPISHEGLPNGASSGSPSSKARALKGKKRAEPTGKNVSTRGMDEAEAIATVKQRIVKFGNLYLGAVKSEEMRVGKRLANIKTEGQEKKPSKRPDLVAQSQMRDGKLCINVEQQLGHINGIPCGMMFYGRAEMYVVGLHKHWLAGICYITSKDTEDGKPLATSIVASGNYEDDEDNGDTLVYTGQGANNLLGDRKQIGDQKLVAGNLALFHSYEKGTPVRVIRGHKNVESYTKKVYTYDGIYKVVAWRPEQGESKHIVYKFTLNRLPDQPPLATERVFFSKADQLKKMTPSGRKMRILCADISGGQENFPVPVVCDPEDEDDDALPPPFKYITKSIKPADHVEPPPPKGCDCKGGCSYARGHKCACAKKNGGEFPYVDDGRLAQSASAVFECNPQCACYATCMNRVSQRGLSQKLEVFRTSNKGWGLRSWNHIAQGTVVCEYVGEQLRDSEVGNRDDMYLFNLDTAKTSLEVRHDRAKKLNLVDETNKEHFEDVEWCLDAAKFGNITRFINHSCDPNLFVQSVFVEHHDVREPRLFLVAMQNIKPLEELSYDYGYQKNSVMKPDGSIKKATCHCGAISCTGRLY